MSERAGARADLWRIHSARAVFMATRDPETGAVILPQNTSSITNGVSKFYYDKTETPDTKTEPNPIPTLNTPQEIALSQAAD